MKYLLLFSIIFCKPKILFSQQGDTLINASLETKEDAKQDYINNKGNESFCSSTMFIINGKIQPNIKNGCELYITKYKVVKMLIFKKKTDIRRYTKKAFIKTVFDITTK